MHSVAAGATVSRHCIRAMRYEPKFVQISAPGEPHGLTCLYALDEDGNVWELHYYAGAHEWKFVGSPAGIEKQ